MSTSPSPLARHVHHDGVVAPPPMGAATACGDSLTSHSHSHLSHALIALFSRLILILSLMLVQSSPSPPSSLHHHGACLYDGALPWGIEHDLNHDVPHLIAHEWMLWTMSETRWPIILILSLMQSCLTRMHGLTLTLAM